MKSLRSMRACRSKLRVAVQLTFLAASLTIATSICTAGEPATFRDQLSQFLAEAEQTFQDLSMSGNPDLDPVILADAIAQIQAARATVDAALDEDLVPVEEALGPLLPRLLEVTGGWLNPGTGSPAPSIGGWWTEAVSPFCPHGPSPARAPYAKAGLPGEFSCVRAQLTLDDAVAVAPCIGPVTCGIKGALVASATVNKRICLNYSEDNTLNTACTIENIDNNVEDESRFTDDDELALHDAGIREAIKAGNDETLAALAAHDAEIKARLDQVDAMLVEIRDLLLTPQGQRPGWPLIPDNPGNSGGDHGAGGDSGSDPGVSLLTAPAIGSTSCGSTMGWPNQDLVLDWETVAGASDFVVELDCLGCKRDPQAWSSVPGNPWYTKHISDLTTSISSHSIDRKIRAAGGSAMRWRVWAVDRYGVEGVKSSWCELDFVGN